MIGLLARRRFTSFLALCVTCASSAALAQLETRTSLSTLLRPSSIAVGDFNGDGRLDLAVAAYQNSDQVSIFLGNGDGTFQPAVNYAAGEGPVSVVTADFNHDGKLDLAVSDDVASTVTVLLGNGDGTFQAPASYALPEPGSTVAAGDFNSDGILDLVVLDATEFCQCVSVLLGKGDGTFQAALNDPVPYNEAMEVGDFNGDGKLDLALAAAAGVTSKMQIMLGNGDGTFRAGPAYVVGADPTSIVVADFNNDGKLDVAVSSVVATYVYVFVGNGDGTFQPPTKYVTPDPLFVTAADLDGDGRVDLVVNNYASPSSISVFRGNGDGTFTGPTLYPVSGQASFTAAGDFNGDHKLDLAVADFRFNHVIVLLNTGTASFSPTTPVTFPTQLVGTTSASQAVTLTNNGTTNMRISSMKAQGRFGMTSTCGTSLAAGASCTINATFSPKSEGSVSGTISIVDSASSKPQVIELAGTGTVVKLSPASLNFGPEKVGSKSAPQTIQLTNTGSTGLNITKIATAGNDPADFPESNNCPSSLSAHTSCTVTVTFGPKKTGARVAAIQITDNGGGSPQSAKLTGTGD